jgi:hypothetical protein
MIYQPELLTCPHCGDMLVMCNYLVWDKTVQRLDRVLSVASRPGRCPRTTCAGSRRRLLSAAGQRIALAGASYGYDVVVRIGWWRQEYRATYDEIHTERAAQVRHFCVPRTLSVSTGLSAAAGLSRATAQRPPGPARQGAGRLDRGTRRLGTPRGRARDTVQGAEIVAGQNGRFGGTGGMPGTVCHHGNIGV